MSNLTWYNYLRVKASHLTDKILKSHLLFYTCFCWFILACEPTLQSNQKEDMNVSIDSINLDSVRNSFLARLETESPLSIAKECEQLSDSLNLTSSDLVKLNMLAGYFNMRGNYRTKALMNFKRAFEHIDDINLQRKEALYCCKTAGTISNELGLIEQATQNYDLALSIARLSQDSAHIYNDYAMLKRQIGEEHKEEEYLLKALELNLGSRLKPYCLGNLLNHYFEKNDIEKFSEIYYEYSKLDNIEPLYDSYYQALYLLLNNRDSEALTIFKDVYVRSIKEQEYKGLNVNMLLQIVESEFKQGELSPWAKEELRQNWEEMSSDSQSFRPRNLEVYWFYLKQLSSENNASKIRAVMEDLNATLNRFKSEQMFRAEKRLMAEYLRGVVEVSLNYYAQRQADMDNREISALLTLFNKSKAIHLQEIVHNPSNLTFEERVTINLVMDSLKIARRSSTNDIELFQNKLALDSLSSLLNIGRFNSDNIAINSINLPKHKATVLYYVGEQDVYRVELVAGKYRTRLLDIKTDSLKIKLLDLETALVNISPEFYRIAEDLYHSIWIQRLDSVVTEISVIPDGCLFSLNFESLCTQNEEERMYVIEQVAVDYSYFFNKKESLKGDSFRECELKLFEPDFRNSERFTTLVSVENETKKVGRKEAPTAANFIRQLQDSNFIYITTHGEYSDGDLKLFFDDNDSLDLNTIFSVKSNASLVLLNACETGRGEDDQIEGVTNFAYALLATGSENVIVNLWQANAYSASKINGYFFSSIDTVSLTSAFRKSKLSYLEDGDISKDLLHPYYWSSSVLFSSADRRYSIKKDRKVVNFPILLILLLGGLGLGGYIYHRFI
ncbi:MAG: hypothetical protein COA58_14815 [Bacteroidetes bacterium]|nr:MAG: hypothetical protein COA58_14815 [Bacteroidota bacterium]